MIGRLGARSGGLGLRLHGHPESIGQRRGDRSDRDVRDDCGACGGRDDYGLRGRDGRRDATRRAARGSLTVVLWAVVAGAALAQDGAPIDGIWLPDASRSQRLGADAPFTAAGSSIVAEWRAAHDPVEDDPGRFCQAPGMPSLALGGADYPVEIVTTPRQVLILMELHQQVRRIFMDLDVHPERLFPQRNGHSIGRWDADTLVVDTVGIKAITFGSVPHSDRVHVVERIRAIDNGAALVNEITISDPVMFTEDIVLRQYYRAAPEGTRMLEYECTEGMWLEHERARAARQAQ